MLYGDDGVVIPNTPEFIDIPDNMLYEIRNARDYLLDVIGSGLLSFFGTKALYTLRWIGEPELAGQCKF